MDSGDPVIRGADTTGASGPPAPLRVVHLGLETPSTRPGGLNRYLADLHDSLRRTGVRSTAVVLGSPHDPAVPPGYVVAGDPGLPLPSRMVRLWRVASRVGDIDVLDCHFAPYALGPVLVASFRRRPVVIHFHGPWADESLAAGGSALASTAKRAIERAVYRRADACVVLSDAFGRLLRARYGLPPWRIYQITPGVDLGAFRPGPTAEARSRLDLDPERWTALAVRRLTGRMGLDVLLRAWAEVVHRLDTPVQLVLVGDGSERANLESLARSLGLADAVRFLGRVDDSVLADCYRAADVSVVPTVALEGFGLVVLESLACGTPVIGTSAGGLPEVLAPLSGDLVVASGDTEALAVRLADAADGRRPLPSPADCRSYAEAFDWPRVAERHVTLYAAVSADRRRRAADRPSLASLPRIAGVRSRPASRPSGRRLRVVVLGHTAQLSGGELAMSRLLPALDDVDVEVLLGEDGPLLQSLEALAVPVDVFPLPRRWSQTRREAVRPSPDLLLTAASGGAFVMALARHLRRLRPDLVHTNTLKAALYGGLACRLAGIPCLWHIRDRIEPDYLPGPAVRLVRSAARVLPRYVVANSESTLATLRLPPRHGEAIPSPVDLAAFRDLPLPAERPEAGGLRIGMVGRISPWKGQDLFLRAFAQAFREGPEQAVIVGAPLFAEEPFADHLEQVVAELGLADRVEFRGFRKDIPQELGRLDVLVHASVTPEPFGQVVVEGMSAGLPVVAAGAGGPAEIITNGIDGLLFSPGDVDSLAALLQQLGRSPSRRRDLGLQGRRTAEAYCPTVVARRVLDVYHRVAP